MSPASSAVVPFDKLPQGGGKFKKTRVPEGDYVAKILSVEDAPTKETKEPQWLFTVALESRPSLKYPYYIKLVENQFWKVRALLEAAGLKPPTEKKKVNPNIFVGKRIGVTLEDDEYDGRLQSSISGVIPVTDVVEGGFDEDKTPPKSRVGAMDDDEPEDEDVVEEENDEEPAPKKKPSSKKAEPEPDEDDDELEMELDDL